MASTMSEDDSSSDSDSFKEAAPAEDWDECDSQKEGRTSGCGGPSPEKNARLFEKVVKRQLYGRFAGNARAKTENLCEDVNTRCRYRLDQIMPDRFDMRSHIYMGFTLCGKFFITFTERYQDISQFPNILVSIEYDLYVWRFTPGQRLQFVSKHRIFKFYKGMEELDEIMFMQFPSDPYKIVCYGVGSSPVMAYVTILTLPSPKSCKHCRKTRLQEEDNYIQGWCFKHGFLVHYVFSMSQPTPVFVPEISLAYPDHLVINTGHYLHILNVRSYEPSQAGVAFSSFHKEESCGATGAGGANKAVSHTSSCNFVDCCSEISESPSDNLSCSNNSVVDAILDDFSEYDMEGGDCNKPFHELNISCEPLNVTGKSYHNALVQNIVDPRLKRLQNSSKECFFSVPQTSGLQKQVEKSKIDKKTAEKAYEFIEENEKCEKLSLFRKKRLADKKYEFSEDNSENIVPFNSLRRDRRLLHRNQNRCGIRSPDFNSTSLFLSPRSPGMRSPMQSPNSRNGQFSPSGGRNIYCTALKNSPHHSKSPISPKDSSYYSSNSRKFNVYSPSLDSDCSDCDSRLILRHGNHGLSSSNAVAHHGVVPDSHRPLSHNGLLIVDSKRDDAPHWIKKVVRRYSSGDFENSSLVSGQSRDDYNIPIEIPLMVDTLTEQHLDVVPECRADHLSEMQLIITQRTFDCEQFVQRRAQKLCTDSSLEFLHCEDYDVKLTHICPIDGHIVCQAEIKIGALENMEPQGKPNVYLASCVFSWNIVTDAFELIDVADHYKLKPLMMSSVRMTHRNLTLPLTMCKKALVMDYNRHTPKSSLRDYNNCYEIIFRDNYLTSSVNSYDGYSTISDSDD